MKITQEYLKSILHYAPETGVFVWLVYRGRLAKIGSIAGCKNNGYIQISIDEKIYKAHRLAFLYMTGEFPKDQVDHRNNIKDDNRFSNLRPATCLQNQRNSRKYKNNTSGFKGVSLRKQNQKWQASIIYNGKKIYLGYFTDKKLAADAYDIAALKYFGEFAKLNNVVITKGLST